VKNTLNRNHNPALIPNTWTIFNWVFLSIYISNSVNFVKTVLFSCMEDRRRLNEKYRQIPTEGPDREMPKSKGPN
jgi:hypothetical protein